MLIKNRQCFFLLLTLLLVGLVIPVQTAKAESADCIESHSGDDAKKCEAEDPLARWRRMQQESAQEKWQQQGCNCPKAAEDDESEDPLHRWERLQCERACHD